MNNVRWLSMSVSFIHPCYMELLFIYLLLVPYSLLILCLHICVKSTRGSKFIHFNHQSHDMYVLASCQCCEDVNTLSPGLYADRIGVGWVDVRLAVSMVRNNPQEIHAGLMYILIHLPVEICRL